MIPNNQSKHLVLKLDYSKLYILYYIALFSGTTKGIQSKAD